MAVKGKRGQKLPAKAKKRATPQTSPQTADSAAEARRVQAEIVEQDETGAFDTFSTREEGEDREIEGEGLAPDSFGPLDGFDPEMETDAAEADARLPVPVSPPSTAEPVSTADPVATYLAEIRRYRLLTKEQEHELAVRYRETGDAKAAEALVTSNLRFVVKIAAEYSRFGAKLIDLIQEGNVGLMHAVREFNPYKGVRLITYAVWWIRGYIQEYLMRQYSMVRIGTTQTQRKLFYRLQKEKELLDSMGMEANIPLLSSRLGVSEEDVKSMSQRLSGRDISLNQPLDSESSASLLDMEASDEPSIDEQLGNAEQLEVLRQNIERIRSKLTEKETYILDNRILEDEPMTLQEIGEHFGVTREAVRQLEARLITKIRNAFNESVEPSHGDSEDEDLESDEP